MIDRREPPLGIKVVVALGGIDGIWHVLAGVLRVLGLLLGQGGLLRTALTIGILAYVYGQKSKYVARSYGESRRKPRRRRTSSGCPRRKAPRCSRRGGSQA